MIDNDKRRSERQKKEKVRRRIRVQVDPDNYEYVPEKKPVDYYNDEVHSRVAIYVRVSTDDIRQTTSYELQKKYYEEFVVRHPNWTLVRIYADEGISGTSLAHRDEFNEMIKDSKAGKIDLIITKSVSRFARNVTDFIGTVRSLSELKNPVGVFFESECIYSLNDDSQMALSFHATMAEEESHTRSRSMETSLRMRLDHGIPLTPKLLGFSHDADGNLVINQEEAPTVKLAFYMYLFGFSTQQIADMFNKLGKRSYLGNVNWTSNGIVQILRNERHCGDVYTRKTYTPNYRDHLSKKNRGERPRSRYYNHHEAIISRDDFIAVQKLLDNAKYGNKSILPKLRVIKEGIFKGYVTVNPRWAGFKEEDYYLAAQSVFASEEEMQALLEPQEVQIEVDPGDFDLRGFEVARSELFDTYYHPSVTFSDNQVKFNTECIRQFGQHNFIEMMVNPINRRFAIRIADKEDRAGVFCSTVKNGTYFPKNIPGAAYSETLFRIFGWNFDYKYRVMGSLYKKDGEIAYIFDANNSEAFLKTNLLPVAQQNASDGIMQPVATSGKRIRAIPETWTKSFGRQVYLHDKSIPELAAQSEPDWKLRIEGQLFESGKKLAVTGFDELRAYIREQLNGLIA